MLSLVVLVHVGCSAPQSTPTPPPALYVATGNFTGVPSGTENQDQVFFAADAAMQSGRFVDAQRDFGTLYLLNPAYGNGIPQAALTQTCTYIGNDCNLLFARLHFIRDALFDQFGPMSGWPPAQSQDFDSILTCYEYALAQNWSTALATGQFIAQSSPLPGFQAAAAGCVNPAQQALAAQQQQAALGAAMQQWDQLYPCMNQQRQTLLNAAGAADWTSFLDAFPAYEQCATPLQQLIDSGVLENNPILGNDYDMAYSNMSEVEAIMFDNEAAIEQTRAANTALASNEQYGALEMELELLQSEESRIRTEMGPLEASLEALSGSAAVPLQQRLTLLQSQLDGVLARRQQVLSEMATMRAAVGLR